MYIFKIACSISKDIRLKYNEILILLTVNLIRPPGFKSDFSNKFFASFKILDMCVGSYFNNLILLCKKATNILDVMILSSFEHIYIITA